MAGFKEQDGDCGRAKTYGEELLHELAKRIPLDSYLSAEQQGELAQVESKDALKKFLARIDVPPIPTDGDIADIAAHFVFSARLKEAQGLGCEGCLLIPFVFQARWLIDARRMGRLRFGVAEVLAFVALVAACLSYEVSIAPVFLGMPQQLLLALPVALLIGAFPSYIFENPRWLVVSFDVIVLMETVALVVWWRS